MGEMCICGSNIGLINSNKSGDVHERLLCRVLFGLRQLTESLLQPNPFLFTPWIIRGVGRDALVEKQPNKHMQVEAEPEMERRTLHMFHMKTVLSF